MEAKPDAGGVEITVAVGGDDLGNRKVALEFMGEELYSCLGYVEVV